MGYYLICRIESATNRIIATLSDATNVTESSKIGCALISAYLASSYNREMSFPCRAGFLTEGRRVYMTTGDQ